MKKALLFFGALYLTSSTLGDGPPPHTNENVSCVRVNAHSSSSTTS